MVKSYIYFSEKQRKLLETGTLEKESNFSEGSPPFIIKTDIQSCSPQPNNICLDSKDIFQ